MMSTKKEPRPSRVPPHDFEPDPDLPVEDYIPIARRPAPPRSYCLHCGLPGEPGDARHPLPEPDPARLADAVKEDHRRLGERDALGGEG